MDILTNSDYNNSDKYVEYFFTLHLQNFFPLSIFYLQLFREKSLSRFWSSTFAFHWTFLTGAVDYEWCLWESTTDFSVSITIVFWWFIFIFILLLMLILFLIWGWNYFSHYEYSQPSQFYKYLCLFLLHVYPKNIISEYNVV